MYAFDAEADALERWDEVSSKVADELTKGHITPLCEVKPKKFTNTSG